MEWYDLDVELELDENSLGLRDGEIAGIDEHVEQDVEQNLGFYKFGEGMLGRCENLLSPRRRWRSENPLSTFG
ncbi:hypothetical protein PIB30_053118 [Stylosanthes scabra]|uniref:Uncharacterized protein n=1 Tax=Stylosanthes scabra TaxID=79078 RepID=A0ABU6WIV6_9FABA|nr:hypothetical protein [Stylosanthes scabra]